MRHHVSFIDSQYTLAIFTVLLTAVVTIFVEKYISYQNKKDNRNAQLRILKNYFSLARKSLIEIQEMNDTQIHPYVNSTIVLTLLRGEYLSPKKDESLIISLNNYISDTEQINRVFNRVDLLSGGFMAGQISNANGTMQNLKKVVPDFLKNLDICIEEIDLKLRVEMNLPGLTPWGIVRE
jgi:hypothetical protein